jgi:glyoxylase-like metal-dependent hydrolase (beta-lactamase superfamily II)
MQNVKYFYHKSSGTLTYIVFDTESKDAVVIDPVLDFETSDSSTSTEPVQPVIEYIEKQQLNLHFILETHAHADHLTAAQVLKNHFNCPVIIGKGITQVQKNFKAIFNLDDDFSTQGEQFDRLVEDGQELNAGTITITVMATPGHTNDSVTYLIGDAAFIGDTLFHPDIGTARCDFPGGSANDLYNSIQKILALPEKTRLFLCHDYPKEREAVAETSIEFHKAENLHIKNNTDKKTYINMREQRDSTLGLPSLIIPSIQVNIRAGHFPKAENNGVSYLKYPLDTLKKK